MSFLVLLAVVCVQTTLAQSQQCYANNDHRYMFFGPGTAYERIYNRTQDPVVIDHCEPQQFWLVSRHGTRYPDPDTLQTLQTLPSLRDEILDNLKTWRPKDSLCAEDLKNLEEWTLQVVPPLASNLAPHGYHDLRNMAERFKSRFPTLLNQTYRRDLFELQYTATQRTTNSAFSFVEGLFGSTYKVYLPDPPTTNMLLSPFSSCDKWVNGSSDTLKEMNEFYNTTTFIRLLQNVSMRLGFNTSLTVDNISTMYDACRYDAAWHVTEISPWCGVFTEDEIKIMEYRDDLADYYYCGYGTEINGKLGCPPVKDFLDRFSQIESGLPQPAGVFYFTHSEMMEMIYVPLGIAKDTVPLTHTNYEEMSGRKWRTSFIATYAANLAAVFFKCDEGEPYRIQFYLGENPLTLEGCNQGICDWSYIKEKFGNISDTCNLDFCGN